MSQVLQILLIESFRTLVARPFLREEVTRQTCFKWTVSDRYHQCHKAYVIAGRYNKKLTISKFENYILIIYDVATIFLVTFCDSGPESSYFSEGKVFLLAYILFN